MYVADSRHPTTTLETKLSSIYQLRSGPSVDLTIRKPYLELLAKLGNPHMQTPPVIHVAGTNGKGSIIAMMRSIIESSGKNVCTYTSPHLLKFNERINLCGTDISDQLLEDLLDEVLYYNEKAPLTFFEITTALAFLAFSRTKADLLLLETGLGGRLDCTNVVNRPLATIISHIGYDHMEFLGRTLPEIAREKAGIMKTGVPCFVAPQASQIVYDALETRSNDINVPLFKINAAYSGAVNLTGMHQLDNAQTAIECVKYITNQSLSDDVIAKNLDTVIWPARLQQINHELLPKDCEFWIDGGHNLSAGHVLAQQAKAWKLNDGKPLHLIIGMMNTKNPAEFAAPIIPFVDSITYIEIEQEPMAFTTQELNTIISNENSLPVKSARNIEDLISNLECGRSLMCGSLYLAANALHFFKQN